MSNTNPGSSRGSLAGSKANGDAMPRAYFSRFMTPSFAGVEKAPLTAGSSNCSGLKWPPAHPAKPVSGDGVESTAWKKISERVVKITGSNCQSRSVGR
jgi:hypothetical protein